MIFIPTILAPDRVKLTKEGDLSFFDKSDEVFILDLSL